MRKRKITHLALLHTHIYEPLFARKQKILKLLEEKKIKEINIEQSTKLPKETKKN